MVLQRSTRLAYTHNFINHNFKRSGTATNCYDCWRSFSAIGRGFLPTSPYIAGAGMLFFDQVRKIPNAARPADALRRFATAVAAIQAFVLLVLVAVIIAASLFMNKSAFTAQSELIDNALDQYVGRVISEQKSIAFWDDAAINLSPEKFNLAWAKVEVGAYLAETYGHKEVYIIGDTGDSIYAFVNGKASGTGAFKRHAHFISPLINDIRANSKKRTYRNREGDFQRQMARYNDLIGARAGRAAANIISLDGKISIVSAITIVPSVDMSLAAKSPPILVSILPVDQKIIDRIGASLLIPDLKLVSVVNGRPTYNIKPLFADDGSIPAELVWKAPTPGRVLLTTILPLVLLASLVAGICVYSLLKRLMKASADLSAREASAVHQSLHDSLSGLPNRSSFLKATAAALKASGEDGLHNIIAYVDIDRFKDINDTLGHMIGDQLIVQVGEALRQALPPSDHVARLGGDEFAILRRAPFSSAAQALGDEIKQAVTKTFDLQGHMTKVEASIGVASFASASIDAEMLLRYADIALYDAKDNGRNQVSHFANPMATALEDRYALESDLRDAVAAENIYMLYQPIIDAQSQQISGVEALVRWRHPLRGIVSPADFVPLAEKSGLMPALGALIFKKVFADAARWPMLEMSINLSPAQMRDANLVPMIQALQQEFQMSPTKIVFEITEGVLLEATDHALVTLNALTHLGFKIALDDFGTGYSSLSYLRQFEFHKLKIDRSFVQEVVTKQHSMWIVQAIVALGTGLGMCVVAEGVETETEADIMCNAGCNELQGYYFSKPVEAGAIDAFFKNYSAKADKKIMPL
jgi:diguanylate cyclase (GGDEF)-like protein